MIRFVCLPVVLIAAIYFHGCSGEREPAENKAEPVINNEEIIRFHREMVTEENQEIEDFCSRYHWNMEITGTGLRYMRVSRGEGTPVEEGDTVLVTYTLKLLTGDVMLNVGSEKPDTVIIGRNTINRGIDEGLRFMNSGDRYRFIVPSHLGYGLLGDFERIPFRSALVYDLTVLGRPGREK